MLYEVITWNWKHDLETDIMRDIADKSGIEKLLSEAGVDRDTTVIVYGDNSNWFAAYALWVLKYYGFENVKLMNGGRKKWIDEGRDITGDIPGYPKTSISVPGPRDEIRALRGEVFEFLEKKMPAGKASLVDVRSPKEFRNNFV